MIKMVKAGFEEDGYLGSLHMLMLMDDTVLFATSKEGLIKKIQQCQDYCEQYGMSVNKSEEDSIHGDKQKEEKQGF